MLCTQRTGDIAAGVLSSNEHSSRTSLRLDVVVDLGSGRLDGAIVVGEHYLACKVSGPPNIIAPNCLDFSTSVQS